ncbi:hypothetical protein [Streptomyces sp. NPDC026673]|uniref:hypothetical protein n=1 Tax=Streptomyces sp. NPDC026673 TaxID=3155724 RepID=UPI0033DD5DC4
MSVRTRRTHFSPSVGSSRWPGFQGAAWHNNSAEDLTTISLIQWAHLSDHGLPKWHSFWITVRQAIDN